MVLRFGLAIGEAALTPSVYSMIGDLMDADRRGPAAILYNAVGMLGASSAYVIGGAALAWIATWPASAFGGLAEWRLMFFLVGVPGLALAIVFGLVAREPPRRGAATTTARPSLADVLRYAKRQGWLYYGLFLGGGAVQLATNAFLTWSPTYMSRNFGMGIAEAGRWFGTYNIVALVGGTVLVPLIGRRLGRWRSDGPVLVSIAGAGLSAMLCVAAVLQSTPQGFLACMVAGVFLATGAANNLLAMVHLITPSDMRATFVALLLIAISTLSLGIAAPLVAAIASGVSADGSGLGVGMGVVAGGGGLLGAVLFSAARGAFSRYVATEGDR